mmetsp:Transcript_17325/g.29048  ORF Transcript_17325/g.29048 Transcript_17325/m.29048 type:complete len:281 (-) Transcript_17325:843-1685(-)
MHCCGRAVAASAASTAASTAATLPAHACSRACSFRAALFFLCRARLDSAGSPPPGAAAAAAVSSPSSAAPPSPFSAAEDLSSADSAWRFRLAAREVARLCFFSSSIVSVASSRPATAGSTAASSRAAHLCCASFLLWPSAARGTRSGPAAGCPGGAPSTSTGVWVVPGLGIISGFTSLSTMSSPLHSYSVTVFPAIVFFSILVVSNLGICNPISWQKVFSRVVHLGHSGTVPKENCRTRPSSLATSSTSAGTSPTVQGASAPGAPPAVVSCRPAPRVTAA